MKTMIENEDLETNFKVHKLSVLGQITSVTLKFGFILVIAFKDFLKFNELSDS